MRGVPIIAAAALLGAVAGCALTPSAPPAAPAAPSASQQAVLALKQEYVDKFLTPATAYALSPRCPQAAGTCSDAGIVADLQEADKGLHDALASADAFIAAAPQADASGPLATARAALTAAEAALPGAT